MRPAKLLLAFALTATAVPALALQWDTPESRKRWSELSQEIYGADASRLAKSSGQVTIDAPETAKDAALVPVAIKVAPSTKSLDFVIDQNPSPIAARVAFGPLGDPRLLTFRVRVDAFTNMHVVAKGEDGKLAENVVFVQGAGGCSAPMGMSDEEASRGMGEMKMKFGTNSSLGAPQATLMVRHPNFNGMQMSQTTKQFTPARFIKSITVTSGDDKVLSMTTDISLSTNPVISFLYKPEGSKPFKVSVVDSSNASWTQSFDPPPKGQQVQR